MARAIIALDDDLRRFLELADNDDTQDELILIIIEAVTEQIENLCNMVFESVTYTDEMYDGDGETVLYLKHIPIIAVTTLQIYDGTSWDTIPSTDYKLYATVGKIVLTEGDVFTSGYQYVKITYSAGQATVPPVIKHAARMMVRYYYTKWRQNRDGTNTITTPDGVAVTYSDKVPDDIMRLLDKYRVVVFG
jgi:uncharacterized phiE125 gp8 family phage protein